MSPSLTDSDIVALNRLTLVARVLSGAVHDLNNSLQIIGGSAEMLGAHASSGDALHRQVGRIQSQTAHAAQVIQQLIGVSRDRGDAAIALVARDLVADALALRTFALRRAGITVEFDPAASRAVRVRGRAIALRQAILNLILNAEQALAPGAGSIRIEVIERDRVAEVQVTDTGRGLAGQSAERLFEPFVTTRPVPDATGLGLPAARHIAREHGGDVTLAGEVVGARAVLRLPAQPD